MSEVKGKIQVIAGHGKGVKINNTWYNLEDPVVPYLAKAKKGDEVELIIENKKVVKLVQVAKEEVKEETKPTCTVCGKVLKDDKYKTCWGCKDKAPKETTTNAKSSTSYTPKAGGYGSAEDVAGKEVGCAAGVAATLLSGRQEDPDTILQLWRDVFNGVLEHIRASK